MAGAFSSIVVCVQGNLGSQGPCADGFVQAIQDVYVIPAAEASAISEFLQPFDSEAARSFFFTSLTATVSIWFVSWLIGTLVRAVRTF